MRHLSYGHLRTLEEQVGDAPLRRAGRGLVLTETGKLVFGYAARNDLLAKV